MIQTLNQFSSESLFDATSHLLHKLHIEFDRETAKPIDVAELYDGPMPKYLTDALHCIKNTFFIGIVNDKSLAGAKSVDSLEDVAETIEHGGKYDGLFVFACDAKQDANLTRSAAAALTRAFNRLASANPVILIIRQNNLLSLSTCERMNYSQEWRQGSGAKLGKVSILRNINCEKPHRGHIDILESLGDKAYATFEELYKHWMDVFNSELLTKQFYNDLFDWYQWAVAPETNVTFPGDVETQDDDREDIDTRVIRLITRLMFVWFIKQKDLVPACIFDEKYLATILKDFDALSTTDSNYYQAILQNLFFGTLNRPIIEDGERREFAQAHTADVKNLYRYSELFSITEDEVIDLFSTVPFLNCGLFECQDKTKTLDGVEHRFYYDGFSRNDRKKNGVFLYRAFVPNILFFHPTKGIISIFNKYVFTIEENTPQDVQVALDPELLGKVFENLLGAYNPETKETARNESGSFYTPREIVQYMVNESLVAHLKQTVGEEFEQQYRQLLDYTTEEVSLTEEQKARILHSLFTCKILDPACGSGAFPMGMLQQMVHILQQVDPDNTMWREVLTNLAVDESRRAFGIVDEEERRKKLLEIEETFNNGLNSPDYTRKLYIIESCIYGVDIQPIAMLISRLRFFITLICEQTDIQREKPELNFGIKTLPNLESKFVAANSLINADIHQYNEDWTQDEVLALLKNELLTIRHRHFYTRKRSEKIRLLREDEAKRKQIHQHINWLVGVPNEEKIRSLQQQIVKHEKLLELYQDEDWVEEAVQKDLFSEPQIIRVDRNKRERNRINSVISTCLHDIEHELNKCTPQGFEAAVLQVTDWNPYDQNSVSPFLDIEWMFGVTDGFDIVIGNPPYRQLQDNGGELANLYAPCGYETYTRMGDIYCLFYERGWQLLKDNSILCYITSNKWMKVGYGELLRDFFIRNTNPQFLIDFGGVQVFESATVDTNVILFNKNIYNHKTLCSITTKQDKDKIKDLYVFVKEHHSYYDFPNDEPWIIMSPIEQSIKQKMKKGVPLKECDIQINYGIKTGNNDVFIISTEKREEILSNCQTEEERELSEKLIQPVLRGRDIKKEGCKWANLWLIGLFPACHYNINDFPAIKHYLLSFAYSDLIKAGYGWVAENYLADFCIQKLSQEGKYIEIAGKKIYLGKNPEKSRKRTSNNWYETQDTIAYWKDFSRSKVVWARLMRIAKNDVDSFPRFAIADKNTLIVDSLCFFVGNNLEQLSLYLNSTIATYYYLKNIVALDNGGMQMRQQYIEEIPCPTIDAIIDDESIFDYFGFTTEEISFIKQYIAKRKEEIANNNDNEPENDE